MGPSDPPRAGGGIDPMLEAQYEAFPYPERDPDEERRRLVIGSPSIPMEIDHHLFGGRRDWGRPFRVLVAGGGTGDGLIQIAALLHAARRPAEITYVDLSLAARRIAEARARVRGLEGIRFLTGSLLDAPALGRFDYIDCCGVLHHLPDPAAGLAALEAALAPGGGIGLMVYAPLGRTGVYPLQEAFRRLTEGLSPAKRVARARAILDRVPEAHPFRLNPNLVDHRQSDAGFHDLLLHGRDRPFWIGELLELLDQCGLVMAGTPRAWAYRLEDFLPDGMEPPPGLGTAERMTLAEKLRGTIKTHVLYAARKEELPAPPRPTDPQQVPHLLGGEPRALAAGIARGREVPISLGSETRPLRLPKGAAALLAAIDGRRTLGEIRGRAGLDVLAFNALWKQVYEALVPLGLLVYSRLLR